MLIIAIVLIASIYGAVLWFTAPIDHDPDSLRHQLQHGRYRVLYAEGHVSQPFNWRTACKIRDRDGATIIPRNFVVGE